MSDNRSPVTYRAEQAVDGGEASDVRGLHEGEERFRRLAEATFEGILIVEQGVIVDANEQLARMIGFELDQIIGAPVGTRVAQMQKAQVLARHRAAYDEPYEITCYHKDGTPLTFEVRGKTIPYQGRTARVVALRDTTEHRRLEEQLRQAQELEALGRVAAEVAHDFNNLLTVILSYGELLAGDLTPADPSHRHAQEIVRACDRAGALTRQLVAFGRRQSMRPERVDLDRVIREMADLLRRVIRSDVLLEIEPGGGGACIEADPGQLGQVILNLAINARDAMPDGGTLVLATTAIELDKAGVAHDPDLAPGAYLRLTVRDTGVGMDEATRARIFEPFFTTKSREEGTGLGLASVYGIVKQSGGSITVDSTPGEGTVFCLDFPRAPG